MSIRLPSGFQQTVGLPLVRNEWEPTYCNIEHHACGHLALIAWLQQIDGFPELKSHAKADVLGQMLH